ncbi:MAG: hypothetical protein KAW17_01790 [Candidatus Eisenbacteria sp.]|nr:hypothetical protein [Candidatus Eisenbacteria bacterium]
MRPSYLLFRNPVHELGQELAGFLHAPEGRGGFVNVVDLCGESGPIVVLGLPDLADGLSGKTLSITTTFVDLCLAKRLVVGQKHQARAGAEPWSQGKLLAQAGISESYIEQYLCWTTGACTEEVDAALLQTVLQSIATSLQKLLRELDDELRTKGERERFFDIEVPVSNAMLRQQVRGLSIDHVRLEGVLEHTSSSLARVRRQLRMRFNLTNPSDRSMVRARLAEAGFDKATNRALREGDKGWLELSGLRHDLPRLLHEHQTFTRDKSTLLKLGAFGSTEVFPRYNTQGTITGRIVITEPSLQNLRRESREVISPRPGRVLLYPDFSQYEPGILADESGDEQLISDYNRGDLYEPLSIALFGDRAHRKHAKTIFIAFCNGMTEEGLVEIASRASGRPNEECRDIVAQFFGKYMRLRDWTEDLFGELENQGRVGSRLGNYRYLGAGAAPGSRARNRWAISQRIQGTASLILKRVIIRLDKEAPDCWPVLPMHDALLCEVPKSSASEIRSLLGELFISCFREECPSVDPRVHFEGSGFVVDG